MSAFKPDDLRRAQLQLNQSLQNGGVRRDQQSRQRADREQRAFAEKKLNMMIGDERSLNLCSCDHKILPKGKNMMSKGYFYNIRSAKWRSTTAYYP